MPNGGCVLEPPHETVGVEVVRVGNGTIPLPHGHIIWAAVHQAVNELANPSGFTIRFGRVPVPQRAHDGDRYGQYCDPPSFGACGMRVRWSFKGHRAFGTYRIAINAAGN